MTSNQRLLFSREVRQWIMIALAAGTILTNDKIRPLIFSAGSSIARRIKSAFKKK